MNMLMVRRRVFVIGKPTAGCKKRMNQEITILKIAPGADERCKVLISITLSDGTCGNLSTG